LPAAACLASPISALYTRTYTYPNLHDFSLSLSARASKDYFDPASPKGLRDIGADPEDSRNC
jgi:hypothetical protein